MGIDNSMLSSDYPFPLGELHTGKMIEEARWLTDEEMTTLLSGHAINLNLEHLDNQMAE
jgi:aminocarboxymuconate-semialdehyde decarboxylase